jgi:hypothetical protein
VKLVMTSPLSISPKARIAVKGAGDGPLDRVERLLNGPDSDGVGDGMEDLDVAADSLGAGECWSVA